MSGPDFQIHSAHHSINVFRPSGISHSGRSISLDVYVDILREDISEPYAAKERKSRTYTSVTAPQTTKVS
jgi:hypothetical protein